NNQDAVLNRRQSYQAALLMYMRAAEHTEAAFLAAPQIVAYARRLETCNDNVASVLRELRRRDDAVRAYERAIEHWARLPRDTRAVLVCPARLHAPYSARASLQRLMGRGGDAGESERQAAAVFERLPQKSPNDHFRLARVQARIAESIGSGKTELTPEEDRS